MICSYYQSRLSIIVDISIRLQFDEYIGKHIVDRAKDSLFNIYIEITFPYLKLKLLDTFIHQENLQRFKIHFHQLKVIQWVTFTVLTSSEKFLIGVMMHFQHPLILMLMFENYIFSLSFFPYLILHGELLCIGYVLLQLNIRDLLQCTRSYSAYCRNILRRRHIFSHVKIDCKNITPVFTLYISILLQVVPEVFLVELG